MRLIGRRMTARLSEYDQGNVSKPDDKVNSPESAETGADNPDSGITLLPRNSGFPWK